VSVGRGDEMSQGPFEREDVTSSNGFSIEHGHADYTDAELLEQAQANAQALLLATVAFLETRAIPPGEWATAVGATLSRGWGEPRPWDAGEFLDAMLTNLRALGAQVIAASLGVERATAVTARFPDLQLCELLGVDPAAADAIYEAIVAIAAPRGIDWSWQRAGDGTVQHIITRRSPDE
jgi:hypothetical protein